MNFIKLHHGNTSHLFPKDGLLLEDVMELFALKRKGLHIKIKSNGVWKNITHVGGIFDMPSDNEGDGLVLEISNSYTQTQNFTNNTAPNNSHANPFAPSPYGSYTRCNLPTISTSSTSERRGGSTPFMGPKNVPSFKNKKTKKPYGRLPMVFKSTSISEIDENEVISTVLDVKIDLKKIEAENGDNFSLMDIQKEAGLQLGDLSTTFILTYKNGVPLKDGQNTRGMSNWNNRMMIRAIPLQTFRSFKPSSWMYVRHDYGHFSGDDESFHVPSPPPFFTDLSDDYLTLPQPFMSGLANSTSTMRSPPTSLMPGPLTVALSGPPTSSMSGPSTAAMPGPAIAAMLGPSTAAISSLFTAMPGPATAAIPGPSTAAMPGPSTASMPGPLTAAMPSQPSSSLISPDALKEVLKTSLKDAMKENSLDEIKQCFKCVCCLEFQSNKLSFCDRCGRYLGCYKCNKKLDKCPICRLEFFHKERTFCFIPGMPDIIGTQNDLGSGDSSDDESIIAVSSNE